jgi:hypothetical protein
MDALDLIVNALCYVLGCGFGMLLGFGLWASKQPAGATVRAWWTARFPANVISIAIAGLGAGVWLDGTLVAWLHLGEWAAVTPAISLVAGGGITFLARRIVAWVSRRADAKVGDGGDDE